MCFRVLLVWFKVGLSCWHPPQFWVGWCMRVCCLVRLCLRWLLHLLIAYLVDGLWHLLVGVVIWCFVISWFGCDLNFVCCVV